MHSENDELRLTALERRLARIEATLQLATPPMPTSAEPASTEPASAEPASTEPAFAPPAPRASAPADAAARQPAPAPLIRPPSPPPARRSFGAATSAVSDRADARFIGSILGWGGALALVLAASYLIRLAIDSGWLTPVRQVAFAAIFGVLLVAAGFAMRTINRQYAGLLPAAGVAVLFLAIYGGHLYHEIIGARQAGVAVLLVCAASLWLCRAFSSDMYALFAVAGSYSAPLLLRTESGSITDLAIYFTAWSVVFAIFAVWHGRRLIYLLAAYLAFVAFDVAWRQTGSGHWIAVLVFQSAQFLIFGLATVMFSVRRQSPLDAPSAVPHLPPLLLFYFLQYTLLKQHLPEFAPWIAVLSLVLVALLFLFARGREGQALPGGELLLSSYSALVLFHAGYVESVPHDWAPWFVVFAVPLLIYAGLRAVDSPTARIPVWIVAGIIALENYFRVTFETEVRAVPAHQLLPVAYALLLYGGYWFARRERALNQARPVMLYMGHLSAMAAALQLLTEPILQSAAWGVLAVACLMLSLRMTDKMLGQSSLAVFGMAAFKVLLVDLKGASPVARIVGLVVLGIALYAGGLLYQRLLGAVAQDSQS